MNIFNKTIFWVMAIFISASIFRLTNMDLIEFKLDEARDVYEMEKFWSEPYFIQRGTIQSTGVYNPPLWYYILVVLSLPSRDPQYLSFMIGLINCLAVAGFYLVVRKFYGQWIGVASGLLMAFSPWMIIFSRKIWAPDLIFPFVVLWFYFINYLGWQPESTPRVSKKKWAWFGLVATLGLLIQLHASGIFLGLASIIIITIITVIQKTKINFKFALLGLCLSLIPLSPYLIYQLQNNCPDCQAFLTYQSGETVSAEPVFDSNAFIRPFQLINGTGFQNALGEEGYRQFLDQNQVIGVFNYIFLLQFCLLPVGIFYLYRFRVRPGMTVVGILFLVPLLVFLTKTAAHLYYFLILSPIVILIYSLGITHPWGVKAHFRGVLIMSVIAVIIVINIIFNLAFFDYLTQIGSIPGDYGSTYKIIKQQAETRGMKIEEFVISAAQVEQ